MQQRTLGFGLVIIGIILLAFTGFNIVTNEKVVDIGPLKVTREMNHPVQWSPIIGVVLFVSGIILVVRDYKHRL